MERLISWLLLGGVTVSMATVLVGIVLMFVHHPEYLKSATDLKRLTAPGAALPHAPGDIARGLAAGRGQAVVVLGLLLLIATPVLRVAVSMIGFLVARDRAFAAISAIVLFVLGLAFFLGRVE